MIDNNSLSVRIFAGNDNVLCGIGYKGCPFNSITSETTAFCYLFKQKLKYYETGNNDICHRCEECKSADLRFHM